MLRLEEQYKTKTILPAQKLGRCTRRLLHNYAISAPCEVKKYDMAKNMTQARLAEAYMFIDTTEPNEKEEEQSLGRELEP